MKRLIAIILVLSILSTPALATADYTVKEIPVKSKTLDDISDSYQVSVTKGVYVFTNPLESGMLKQELIKYYKPLCLFGFASLALTIIIMCPALGIAFPALAGAIEAYKEGSDYLQSQKVLKAGDTEKVLVLPNVRPILERTGVNEAITPDSYLTHPLDATAPLTEPENNQTNEPRSRNSDTTQPNDHHGK